MGTAFADSALTWDYLLRTWRDLEVPEGWRPELMVEEIRMTPPPGGQHNLVADVIHEALVRSRPEGCGIFQTLGAGIRQIGGIYVPDLCVAPPLGNPARIGAGSGGACAARRRNHLAR